MSYAIRKLDDTEFENPFDRAYVRVKEYTGQSSFAEEGRRRYRSRSISRSRSRSNHNHSRFIKILFFIFLFLPDFCTEAEVDLLEEGVVLLHLEVVKGRLLVTIDIKATRTQQGVDQDDPRLTRGPLVQEEAAQRGTKMPLAPHQRKKVPLN